MGNYPSDDDGQALARIEAEGSDMSQPMEIEFFIVTPSESKGVAISEVVQSLGFVASLEYDDESNEWICYAKREMVPTYEAVTRVQADLHKHCYPLHGELDGWGTYGNAPAS